MPSRSKPQAKLMRIAAVTPGGYGGVPQSVGKEFNAADQLRAGMKSRIAGRITSAPAYSKSTSRVGR